MTLVFPLRRALACGAFAFFFSPIAHADDPPAPSPARAEARALGSGLDAFADHLAAVRALQSEPADSELHGLERVVRSIRDAAVDPMLHDAEATCAQLNEGLPHWQALRETHPTPDDGGAMEVRALLDLARACDNPALHEDAMRALSRYVGHARATHWDVATQRALIRYTNFTDQSALARIDARALIPLFEALIDIEDFRALERTTALVSTRIEAAQEALARYRGYALAQPEHSVRNDLPPTCALILDDEPRRERQLKLRAGTWRQRCEGQNTDSVLSVNAATPSLLNAPRIE